MCPLDWLWNLNDWIMVCRHVTRVEENFLCKFDSYPKAECQQFKHESIRLDYDRFWQGATTMNLALILAIYYVQYRYVSKSIIENIFKYHLSKERLHVLFGTNLNILKAIFTFMLMFYNVVFTHRAVDSTPNYHYYLGI